MNFFLRLCAELAATLRTEQPSYNMRNNAFIPVRRRGKLKGYQKGKKKK